MKRISILVFLFGLLLIGPWYFSAQQRPTPGGTNAGGPTSNVLVLAVPARIRRPLPSASELLERQSEDISPQEAAEIRRTIEEFERGAAGTP